MLYSRAGHMWQYGACAFYARYLRLQTHTQNIQYLLLFHCISGYANAPQCYIVYVHWLSCFPLQRQQRSGSGRWCKQLVTTRQSESSNKSNDSFIGKYTREFRKFHVPFRISWFLTVLLHVAVAAQPTKYNKI